MVDERFQEEYLKICTTDPKEASLFALASLSTRHIHTTSSEHFNIINDVLNNNEFDSNELKKVKSVIDDVLRYDNNLIEYLTEIEKDVCEVLYRQPSQSNECNQREELRVERQRKNIKKWWE